jgi:hypothetical protein
MDSVKSVVAEHSTVTVERSVHTMTATGGNTTINGSVTAFTCSGTCENTIHGSIAVMTSSGGGRATIVNRF